MEPGDYMGKESEIDFSKLPETSWELHGTLKPQHYKILAISGLSGKLSKNLLISASVMLGLGGI